MVSKQELIEKEMEEFCRNLGILSARDTDKTVVRVFRVLVQERRFGDKNMGSTELSNKTQLNRITVIHHLKRLNDVGVVEKQNHKYALRGNDLMGLMQEFERERLAMLARMRKMAVEFEKEFDRGLMEF